METRIRIAAPFGTVFQTVPQFLLADMGWPFRDTPSLSLHYPSAGVNSALLNGECEAVFEYWTGSVWVEPMDSRYRLTGVDRDRLEKVPTKKFSFKGLFPSMLSSAYVWEPAGLTTDVDGNIIFAAVTPGVILRTLFLNAQGRGWGSALNVDFTDTRDSNGALWSGVINLTVNPAQSLYEILTALGNQGVVDWAGQGRTLRVFNPDSFLGRQLPNVRLLAMQGETAAPENVSHEDQATVMRVVGDDGLNWDRANPPSPWGRLESIMSAGGVKDEGTAFLLSDEELLKASGARISRTREFDGSSAFLPHRDYRGGDHVSYQTDTGMESMRVFSVALTVGRTVTGHVVLGDRFEDALIKAARKQNSLTVGKVSGGNGQQPSNPGDFRNPGSPIGFIASSSVYLSPQGDEVGRVHASWSHTGKATDGTAITIDRFEFRIRESGIGEADWRSFLSVPGDDRSGTFSPVRVRREDGQPELYDFAIRAVSAASRVSPWVYYRNLLMATDTTPPPVPSAPIGAAQYSAITMQWDGLGEGGELMPPDFLHTEAEIGESPTGPWIFAGNFERSGGITIPFPLPYGTYWLRLRSVDRTGNKSDWSALGEVTTVPLVDLPDFMDVLDQFNTELDSVRTSANGANRIANKTTPPVIDGLEREGDTWFQWTPGQHLLDPKILIGQWMWMDDAYAAFEMGHQVVSSIDFGKGVFGVLDGDFIKTGTLHIGNQIVVADMNNLASLNPDLNSNISYPELYATETVGGFARKVALGPDRLVFMNQAGPVPVQTGDWIRMIFTATTTTAVSAKPTIWIFPNADNTDGPAVATASTIAFDPGTHEYTADIQIPNLSGVDGGLSWMAGLDGAGIRSLGVRLVRVYKKTNATLISPGSILTPHLGAQIIEAGHIKVNSITGDRMSGGFADFIVMTGSTVQTVAAVNRGIKLVGDTNSLLSWNLAGERTFKLDGDTGDVLLGKNNMIQLFGSTGNLNIGNGKFTVSGSNGDLTIGANQVFKVDGSTGNLNIGNGKMTVNGTTGAIVVANASITGATIIGGRIEMIGTGSGIGYDIKQYVDQYGMAVTQFWTPNSDTPGTIRVHQDGTELNPGDEYDPGPPFTAGGTQMVIRAPRRTGFTENRAVLFLQSWNVNNGPYDQPRVVNRGDFYLTGTGAYSGDSGVLVDAASTHTLDIGMYAGAVRSTVIRDRAYTGAANVYVTDNGFIGQSSSASRFKIDQQVMDLSDALLDIPVKDWIDKTSTEEVEELQELGVRTARQQSVVDSGNAQRRIPGVVAEDVADVDGGQTFVTRDSNGELQGVAYDRLAIAQIAVLTRKVKYLESLLTK